MTALATLWLVRSAFAELAGFPVSPRRAVSSLRKMILRRRTLSQLSSLDDGALKDIGLHRSEIMAIAYDPSRRPTRSR
jgi:uncharacterized protein YjiS (DUF1127 family)